MGSGTKIPLTKHYNYSPEKAGLENLFAKFYFDREDSLKSLLFKYILNKTYFTLFYFLKYGKQYHCTIRSSNPLGNMFITQKTYSNSESTGGG